MQCISYMITIHTVGRRPLEAGRVVGPPHHGRLCGVEGVGGDVRRWGGLRVVVRVVVFVVVGGGTLGVPRAALTRTTAVLHPQAAEHRSAGRHVHRLLRVPVETA